LNNITLITVLILVFYYRNTKNDAILGYRRMQQPSAPSGD